MSGTKIDFRHRRFFNFALFTITYEKFSSQRHVNGGFGQISFPPREIFEIDQFTNTNAKNTKILCKW